MVLLLRQAGKHVVSAFKHKNLEDKRPLAKQLQKSQK